MKSKLNALIIILVVAWLALPRPALAQGTTPQDRTVLGGTFTLAAGQSLRTLDVVGGDVTLMAGSQVEQVYLYGGNLTVNGSVTTNIRAYGGNLQLGDTARVASDVTLIGGNLERANGAQVGGQVSTSLLTPFNFRLPAIGNPVWFGNGTPVNDMFSSVWWLGVQSVALTALAVLVVLFAPRVTERAGSAALSRPWEAGGLGLLIAVITPPLLVGFAITIIGIPVMLVLIVVAGAVLTFGWIALGLEVGKRLAHALNVSWSLLADAALGTLLLTLVANSIGLTPCVGWVVPTLIGFVGMGGVVLALMGAPNSSSSAAPILRPQ